MTQRTLRHTYERNYFKAPLRVPVGPLRAEIYYLFEVTKIVPPRKRTLGEVRLLIARRLIVGPLKNILTRRAVELGVRWRAKTRCRMPGRVDLCSAPL